jgi:hypothetical protein
MDSSSHLTMSISEAGEYVTRGAWPGHSFGQLRAGSGRDPRWLAVAGQAAALCQPQMDFTTEAQRARRSGGENTVANKQGTAISTRGTRNMFLCGLRASVVSLFLAAELRRPPPLRSAALPWTPLPKPRAGVRLCDLRLLPGKNRGPQKRGSALRLLFSAPPRLGGNDSKSHCLE